MWLDLIIILTVIISMAHGYRKGFVGAVLRAFGWLLSIIAAMIIYPYATDWLESHTEFYGNIRLALEQRFSAHISAKAGELTDGIPHVIAEAADRVVSALAVSLADGVATVCFSIAVYLALVLAVKLLAFLLVFLFSKRSRGNGIIGGVDSVLGLVFGAVRGMLIAFVLLALILPLSLLIGESANKMVSDALFSSIFAGELYDNNPLLMLAGGFLKF